MTFLGPIRIDIKAQTNTPKSGKTGESTESLLRSRTAVLGAINL